MSKENGEAPDSLFEKVAGKKAGFFTTLFAIELLAVVIGIGLATGFNLAIYLGVNPFSCPVIEKSL